MRFQRIKNQKFKDSLFYLIIFCIVVICLISITSPAFAKLTASKSAQDKARLIYFQPLIRGYDITNANHAELKDSNSIEFDQQKTSRNFQFSVLNTSEAVIHVTAIELTNASGLELPDYEITSETDFYLFSGETKYIYMNINSAQPSYFYDIQEELHLEFIAEQVD
jgi:hypothetical protein